MIITKNQSKSTDFDTTADKEKVSQATNKKSSPSVYEVSEFIPAR